MSKSHLSVFAALRISFVGSYLVSFYRFMVQKKKKKKGCYKQKSVIAPLQHN